jgi:diguanylate cyclase (GGDEF)-like protein
VKSPGALGSRVTRRVVGLFVACALLPVALAIALSYSHVQEALLAQRIGQLRDAAANYGSAVVERLGMAELLARSTAHGIDGGGPDLRKAGAPYFRAAVVIERSGQRIVFGNPSRLPDLAEIDALDPRLVLGETSLVVSGGGSQSRAVWLIRAAPPAAGVPRRIALELDPRYLWGASDELPYLTDICALDARGEPLNCSQPLPEAALADIRARLANEVKGDLAWQAEGARHLSGFREIFLKGKFGSGSWSVVATQPEEYALAPVESVKRLVVPVVLLGLLVAAFLGLVQVRRTLGPLKELTDATAKIAARDFNARVPQTRDDEFGVLARAFNSMSARLGRQFHALEAQSEIDAVILSNVDTAQVAAIALRRMAQVAVADRRCLLLADPAQHATYRVHESGSPDSLDGRSIVLTETETQRLLAASGGMHAAECVLVGIGALADLRTSTLYALPIVLGDELAGAIVLGYDTERRPDADEIADLRDLADRVAVALATAKRDQELHRRAHYDSLTQLPNRLLGLDELARAVATAARHERTLAVLFVDLDGFSAVNDSLGHVTGDELLVQVADRLRQCVRKSDIVARLGGDEFAVILPEIREANDAALVASHAIESLSRQFDIGQNRAFISASVGIALFPADGATGDDLLRHADLAMYRAKHAGRGQAVFFEPSMNEEAQRRLTLERELRCALEEEQFTLFYQPQLDVASDRIIGAEALIRWNHPDRGLVSPGHFIAFAEASPIIEDIGRWALKTACAQFAAWRKDGLDIDHVSVNVAPRQFQNPAFTQVVADALRESGMPARALRLEITETAVLDQGEAAEANLAGLGKLGTPLELDDFGTGYSSLAYLQRLSVATVKLDLALIRTIDTNQNNRAVVRAAIDMVHALEKTVVAEGVERAEQLAILAQLGCDAIQGYYLSPPIPAAKFAQFVRDRARGVAAAA